MEKHEISREHHAERGRTEFSRSPFDGSQGHVVQVALYFPALERHSRRAGPVQRNCCLGRKRLNATFPEVAQRLASIGIYQALLPVDEVRVVIRNGGPPRPVSRRQSLVSEQPFVKKL